LVLDPSFGNICATLYLGSRHHNVSRRTELRMAALAGEQQRGLSPAESCAAAYPTTAMSPPHEAIVYDEEDDGYLMIGEMGEEVCKAEGVVPWSAQQDEEIDVQVRGRSHRNRNQPNSLINIPSSPTHFLPGSFTCLCWRVCCRRPVSGLVRHTNHASPCTSLSRGGSTSAQQNFNADIIVSSPPLSHTLRLACAYALSRSALVLVLVCGRVGWWDRLAT
jgi:hypothetical protein